MRRHPPKRLLSCQRPLTHVSFGSLDSNALCGVDQYGDGYTAEGITKLCKGLKGSAVTSLECAAPTSVCLSVNAR